MVVKVPQEIWFPNWGWLSTRIAGPQNGRVLIEIRGHSGQRSWLCALLTAPEGAVRVEGRHIYLQPGTYRAEEGQDRRGNRLIRLYPAGDSEADLIGFGVDGFVVPEASDPEVMELVQSEGHSRSGQQGDRWALVASRVGAVVAVQPYERPDPRYYRVLPEGLLPLGESDGVLAPDEW